MTTPHQRSMGSHQSASAMTVDWLTPPNLIESLGLFDLDPCASVGQPWRTALKMLTVVDDGYSAKWDGRVWLNPPYGKDAARWLAKLSEHRNGIALVFARTETRMFFDWVWPVADSLLFIEGRLHFHYPDGSRAKANSGAPSVLIAYGESNTDSLRTSGIPGRLVNLK